MFVDEVAEAWGITNRSVYRMIEEGVLPTSSKTRDRPMILQLTLHDVDDGIVQTVKSRLVGNTAPVAKGKQIRRILKELKGGKQ